MALVLSPASASASRTVACSSASAAKGRVGASKVKWRHALF
jgi:hypothetical protein